MKPEILISFHDFLVSWHSVGWENDEELMEEAKRAINEGETPEAVIANLEKTFTVTRKH